MIVLTLGGGLGNQMFEYAFARKLQRLTGDEELKFAVHHVVGSGNSEKMLFRLNIREGITFCDEREQKEAERMQSRQNKVLRFYRVLSRYLRGALAWRIQRMSRHGFYTDASLYNEQKHEMSHCLVKYVSGAFQTYLYWQDMIPEIRSELKVKKEPSKENLCMLKEIKACEAVCVHIRRGDYLAPQFAHLNVCDRHYYMTAMKKMKEQRPSAVFYIFTNNHEEILWIQKNYDFEGYEVRYVDLNNPDYEELRLMYHCKHFIISNSTYSWWGQFLSDNEDKIVMAPSIWNREMNADGIYMPGWQVIDV
ncbi:MAG: alpha-1,2-fucosyltransferase [Roseburia sp.]